LGILKVFGEIKMESCYNHPERKAYSICHSCGRHFCEDCLTAGKEFYYCKSPGCQKKYKEDTAKVTYSEKIVCPNCQSVLQINRDEIESGSFRCPECESFIAIMNGKPESVEDKNYVQLLSSLNQGDIAIIKSMLDDAEVDYYLTGENFLGVRPLLEPAVFYVNEKDLELAKNILKDFELHLFGFSTNNEEGVE
jgi:hypothetical protein